MTHKPLLNILVVVGLLALPLALGQGPAAQAAPDADTLYVQPGATGNCSSWVHACELQTALSLAAPDDEIWVAQGVYTPTLLLNPVDARSACFQLESGVALYGGFAGTEDDLDQRDWTENVTVLSGDIDGNDVTDPNGVVTDTVHIAGVNAYHVVTGSGVNATAILDGFTITAGNANGDYPHYNGGGMYNESGSPTLTNVTFSGNSASVGGGMANISSSSPTLTDVTFSGNSASVGGGISNQLSSDPTLSNVTFAGNSADVGGGMFNGGSIIDLTNVPFSGSHADYVGGISDEFSSNPTLTDVTFYGNSAYGGGGMLNDNSSPTLINVSFIGNEALLGGGIYNYSSDPTLTNITFSGNEAPGGYGGGIYNDYSNPPLTNVTFSGNKADYEGGGMFNYVSSPRLINVTFIGNGAGWGAGMSNQISDPLLINAVFRGNTAVYDGGGIHNYNGSNPTLINVTLESNSADRGGGMDSWDSSSPTLTNTILWGNTATTDGAQIYKPDVSGTVIVSYSLIEDGCPPGVTCDHLLSVDPQFVDAANGNLRLQHTSPAIDAGRNAAVPPGVTTDLDGSPRFVNIASVPDTGLGIPPIVDMGAYEAQIGSAIIYVDKTAPGPIHDGTSWVHAFTGLQAALATAKAGNEIWVASEVYYPGIIGNRLATFQLKDGVALYGGFDPDSGADTFIERNPATYPTVLSGDIDDNDVTDPNGVVTDTVHIAWANAYHVVTGSGVEAKAILDGFTITAGNANGDYPHYNGGGMYNVSGSPTLTDVTFSGNSANWVGGGMVNFSSSSPTLTDVTFSANSADYAGGGMFNGESSPDLTNATFSGSNADYVGGISNELSSDPTLTDVTFSGNSSEFGGGMLNDNSSPTLMDVTFSGNEALGGGGIYNYYSDPTLTNITFSGNNAEYYGGGMYNDNSSSTLTNVTFSGNEADEGGGIYNFGMLTMLTLVTSTVGPGNNVLIQGGGVINYGGMVISDTTVVGNSGTGVIGGAGIANYGTLVITNTTVSSNFTNVNGGGIYLGGGTLTLTNATITANIADYDHSGGGSGGGIFIASSLAQLSVKNTIIANNPGADCAGVQGWLLDSLGYNMDSDDTCQLEGTGDKPDTNPQLGPLADNGGPTFTHALFASSPAIDAGDPLSCPATDQRGMPRPVDGDGNGQAVCDMGAYEFQLKLYLPLTRK